MTTTLNHIKARVITAGLLLPALLATSLPAAAGGGATGGVSAAMTKAKTMLTDVSTGVTGFGLIVVTIAILFVGFRMIFRSAQWADLAPIFWGGMIVGGAATIAGAFF